MNFIQGIILGLIQGATEFLPVSSSGHLVLLQNWYGIKEPPVFFDVMLHFATLIAVVYMFRAQILSLITNGLNQLKSEGVAGNLTNPRNSLRYISFLLVGTLVTGVIGLAFEDYFEEMFSNPGAVGVALIITGLLLISTLFVKRHRVESINDMRIWQALLIGFAQSLAIMPGLSRSGTTIVAALLLGLAGPFAVEFSFLLSIPVILGVTLKEIITSSPGLPLIVIISGMLSALIAGYCCLFLLKILVRRGKIHWFALYCIPVGIIVIYVSWLR